MFTFSGLDAKTLEVLVIVVIVYYQAGYGSPEGQDSFSISDLNYTTHKHRRENYLVLVYVVAIHDYKYDERLAGFDSWTPFINAKQ